MIGIFKEINVNHSTFTPTTNLCTCHHRTGNIFRTNSEKITIIRLIIYFPDSGSTTYRICNSNSLYILFSCYIFDLSIEVFIVASPECNSKLSKSFTLSRYSYACFKIIFTFIATGIIGINAINHYLFYRAKMINDL